MRSSSTAGTSLPDFVLLTLVLSYLNRAGIRAANVASLLCQTGFKNVKCYYGSMNEWMQS